MLFPNPLYKRAIEVVVRERLASCGLLQRALGIGFGRASRLIAIMDVDGIVGEFLNNSEREVLCTRERWESLKNGGESAESAA